MSAKEIREYDGVTFVHMPDGAWYLDEPIYWLRLKGLGLSFKAPLWSLIKAVRECAIGHFDEARHLISTGWDMARAAHELFASSDPEIARMHFAKAERVQHHEQRHEDMDIPTLPDSIKHYMAPCMQPFYCDHWPSLESSRGSHVKWFKRHFPKVAVFNHVKFTVYDKSWYRNDSIALLRLKGAGLIFKAPVLSLARAVAELAKGIFARLTNQGAKTHFKEAKHFITTGWKMTKAAYGLLLFDAEAARIRFGAAEREQHHGHEDLPIYRGAKFHYMAVCMQPLAHDGYSSPDYRPNYAKRILEERLKPSAC